jgi:alpha-ketoglutarate-dependent taurine dioxygenase
MAISYQEIQPDVGVVVSNDKNSLLGGHLSKDIRRLLEEHGVVIFPQTNFSEYEQIRFTKTLGEYVADRDSGEATYITIDPEAGQAAQYTRSSFFGTLMAI